MNEKYRPIMLLRIIAAVTAMVIVTWFLTTVDQDTYFCTLCWKEGIWSVKRWIGEKIFFRPQETICRTRCKSNLIQLTRAIFKYASDHNGYLPDSRDWEQQVLVYHKNHNIYKCPDAPIGQTRYYCMNPRLSKKKLKKIPKETILLFECDSNGKPVARHHFLEFKHLCHVVFIDGHVEGLPPDKIPEEIWASK